MKKKVIIIGAGPAGLTAALELIRDGRMNPIILEASDTVGGISRTVVYKGNRLDIGGHRFFSKSDWVMDWWKAILPVAADKPVSISYQGKQRWVQPEPSTDATAHKAGQVMLIRNRLSRIYFLRKYFDYPIKLNGTTLANLGVVRLMRIGVGYLMALLFPRRPERSLEDFLINRFGGELYRTFFRDYTEKVWGNSCDQISAEWGAQRIKGLSIFEALRHALRSLLGKQSTSSIKTSLIEHFLYPRLGPGQLWEEVARQVKAGGGEIRHGLTVTGIKHQAGRVYELMAVDEQGIVHQFSADYVISTMPVKDLVIGMQPHAPQEIADIARDLPYRDFITVGLLVKKMRPNVQAKSVSGNNMPADNWIYIQESDVKIGRLQIFNNWSPDLVNDSNSIWLGLEYFCQEGDTLWQMQDNALLNFAAKELDKIGMLDEVDVLDGTVIRVPKTYPAYFGAYADFPRVRAWLDELENLFLVGRNGMHRYNNQDHSMLTAKRAVEAILSGSTDKNNIWSVNIDDEYHEA